MVKDILIFNDRQEFRKWLFENCQLNKGVWLIFDKSKTSKTINAQDALEEALCFGWIDGQMKSIDEKSYKKYFSMRRVNSKWSNRNKNLTIKLEQQGLMTEFGRLKIAEAKKNGKWDLVDPITFTDEHIMILDDILKNYEPAYTNFKTMSHSVKRTYTRAYFDAKTEAGREKRIAWIVDRLNKNLKPM